MQRFQLDRPIMVKRWRQEWAKHGHDFGRCHCAAGMGTMRKHRPYESHPSSSCRFCMWQRQEAIRERRQQRYAARKMIEEGFSEYPMATDLELMRQLRNDAATLLQRAETVSRLLPDDVRCVALAERIHTLKRTIWEYDQEIMTARENQIGSGIVGEPESGDPANDAEHIGVCPYCDQAVDLRELGQVIHHNTPGHGPIAADA